MNKEEITITVPKHIKNIFDHSSGEIDYLKNTFDDREFNQGAFYELNFQIYKNLLKEEKYDDDVFLEVKRNLYYLEESGVSVKEISFKFSKKYLDKKGKKNKNFIDEEVLVSGSDFDKFYSDIYNENIDGIKSYIDEKIQKVLKEKILININWCIFIVQNILNNDKLFDLKKNIFSKKNLSNYFLESNEEIIYFISTFNSDEGFTLFKELSLKDNIISFIVKSNRNMLRFVTSFLNSKNYSDFLKYLDLDNELIYAFEEYSDYMGFLQWVSSTKNGLNYLDNLGLSKLIIKNDNRNFNWLVEKISQTKYGQKYLKGLNNKKIDDIFLANEKSKIHLEGSFGEKELEKDYLFEINDEILSEIRGIIFKNINIEKSEDFLYNNHYFDCYNRIIALGQRPKKQNYLKQILKTETNDLKIQLTDFIKTSNSGSCLLSGYRGTGKTTLIKSVVKQVHNENKNIEDGEDIIEVIINIPEQKRDENGEKKSFSKNELITKIVREIYLSLKEIKNSDGNNKYGEKEIKDFEEQYIRTFNNIENKKSDIESRELSLSFTIENLFLSIFTIGIMIAGFSLDFAKKDVLFAIILIVLGFFVFKVNWKRSKKSEFSKIEKELYNDDIAENKLNENIKNFTKNKKRKLVIIIDELDKLLDLEKKGGNDISMKEIFDLLGKLKTLFFDNTGAIFFVVTNKDAYNYFLENRNNEDDLISNIFNKVLYLPMTKKEKFNLNRTFLIDGIDENKSEYINNLLYYKSHGNWRKGNFILNQKIQGNIIKIDKKEIEYDKKFYQFMDILYDMFFDETKKKFLEYVKSGESFYEFVNRYLNVEKKEDYKIIVGKLLIGINKIKLPNKKSKKIILTNIESLEKRYSSKENFDSFAYMFSSVDKISGQPAYRDYIINNILNIIEILKHDRSLRLEDIFYRLKFGEVDVKYPVFEDLVLIWIPFMIYYFDNSEKNEK